jgi:hypothetical protein
VTRRLGQQYRPGQLIRTVACAFLLVLTATTLSVVTSATAQASPVLYAPQPQRNAEWDGWGPGFSTASVTAAAQNLSYFVVNKGDHGGRISMQYPDINNIAAAGAAAGTGTKAFAYFMATRWSLGGWNDLAPYSSTFPAGTAWYLLDYQGHPVPYYFEALDPQHTKSKGSVIDTSNPNFRAWLVSTVAQWLVQANFSGIFFDASNVVDGTSLPTPAVSDGVHTWNEILCGPGTYTTSCPRVVQMNDGLRQLIQAVSAAVHSLGMEVAYNGIAPNIPRGPTRNIGLLDYADIASNEAFCLLASGPSTYRLVNPLADWQIMDEQASRGKKLFEVTDYLTDSFNTDFGSYCAAEFMLGWHPGSDYLIYHRDYGHQISATPAAIDINLNLGNPTGARLSENSVYTRTFQNGFVALNPTKATEMFHLPAAMTLFANGQAVVSYPAHALISMPSQASMMFLYNSYLY